MASMDQTIIAGNDASRRRLRAALDRLQVADYGRTLPDGWTVGATLGHLTFWDRRALILLQKLERTGLTPSPSDVDTLNDALLPQWAAVPPAAVARLILETADAVDGKIAALSDAHVAAILAAGTPFMLDRAKHRNEHLDEIERLLGR